MVSLPVRVGRLGVIAVNVMATHDCGSAAPAADGWDQADPRTSRRPIRPVTAARSALTGVPASSGHPNGAPGVLPASDGEERTESGPHGAYGSSRSAPVPSPPGDRRRPARP